MNRRNHFSLAVTLGSVLVAFGAVVMTAGFGLVTLPPALMPGFADCLAITTAGIALLFVTAPTRICRLAQISLGVVLLLLASAALIAPLGVDTLVQASVGETIAIALMGATLLAFHSGWRPVLLARVGLISMLAVALTGIAGHLLALEILYRAYLDLRLALALSIGMLIFSAGLWFQSYRMAWDMPLITAENDKRIPLFSGLVVLVIAVSAGLAGFALMARTTQELLTANLNISLEHRLRAFQVALDSGYKDIRLASTRPRFNVLMGKLARAGITETERQEVQKILDDIIKNTPITALTVIDNRGRLVGQRGELVQNPPFSVTLADKPGSRLIWNANETAMRARLAIGPKDQPVGVLEAEVPLPAIDRLFRDFAGLGQSGTMGVCATHGDGLVCMPSRANKYRVVQATRLFKGTPVPMHHALNGQSGVSAGIDIHGEQIYSAYAPIGKSGLGMIVKVHTNELYLPVSTRLGMTLVTISLLVVIGFLLLRWLITPLARHLVSEIRERKLAEERFAHLAHHDSLTNLPNRVLFHDRLQQAMTNAQRHHQTVAVMFLDVDRFKSINDTFGHDAGDDMLKQIAARLTERVRAGDTVSRLAGDEFAIVLPGIDNVQYCRLLALRLIEAFTRPFTIREQELFVTMSLGITLYPADAETVEGLLKNADTAMYRAKDSGRNTFQFYAAEMHAQAVKRLALENQLRGAIERHELVVHYQPLVDLKSGRISGMEALLRWNNPKYGAVPPSEFIPLAEESGLIIPIGRWVLRTACAQAKAWQDAGLPALRLSVNLSVRQFQGELVETVSNVLQETGLEPQWLQLELTESVMMRDPESAAVLFEAIDRLGVRFALDDFGTGYSSLSYLKRFPIDALKIDRSFVSEIPRDEDDMVITTAIISLAHSLGIKVVAEGVETPEQLTFLRRQHCDEMQGYLFSKPLPADEFEKIARDGRTLSDRPVSLAGQQK